MATEVNEKGSTRVVNTEWLQMSDDSKRSRKETHRILENTPFFTELPKADWRQLETLFHHRQFETNETIFYEGTPGLGMYVILDGKVRILSNKNGRDVEYALLEQGDFFGELSLVEEEHPRSATAVAVSPTRLIGFFRPQLLSLLHTRPKLGVVLMERLARSIAKRLRESNKLLEQHERLED